jgi:hypothetical protein
MVAVVELFRDNWLFQEGYWPQVQDILRKCFYPFIRVEPSTVTQDTKEGFDAVVTLDSEQVALRIRRETISFRDLTIRSYKNGHKTELDKLREGFGRWYLYAWTESGRITEWMLIDMNKVRATGLLEGRVEKSNTDGQTRFVTVSLFELGENDCIIQYELSAKSWAVAHREAVRRESQKGVTVLPAEKKSDPKTLPGARLAQRTTPCSLNCGRDIEADVDYYMRHDNGDLHWAHELCVREHLATQETQPDF